MMDLGWIILIAFVLLFLMITAATWMAGLWNNILTLVNLILAGVIALGFFTQLGQEIATRREDFVFQAMFVSIWIIFVVAFVALRTGTEMLSRHKLKFDPVTEMVGRSVASLLIAAVLLGFSLFTLHLAPLPAEGDFAEEFDQFAKPDSAFGLGLDEIWANATHSIASGSMKENPEMAWMLSRSEKLFANAEGDYFLQNMNPETNQATYSQIKAAGLQPLPKPLNFVTVTFLGEQLRRAYVLYHEAKELEAKFKEAFDNLSSLSDEDLFQRATQ